MATNTTNVDTYDGHGNLVGSRTVTWTTTPEQDNADTLRQQAVNALTNNRTYVALTSPTSTQTVAQVQALTRQNNGIIRLLLGLLDGTN